MVSCGQARRWACWRVFDGAAWHDVPLPARLVSNTLPRLLLHPTDCSGPQRNYRWRVDDGNTWTEYDLPERLGGIQTLGSGARWGTLDRHRARSRSFALEQALTYDPSRRGKTLLALLPSSCVDRQDKIWLTGRSLLESGSASARSTTHCVRSGSGRPLQAGNALRGVDSSGRITIRELLSHTSGLADYFEQRQRTARPSSGRAAGRLRLDLRRRAAHHEGGADAQVCAVTPGKAFYSDTNYQLLGVLD